jgi:diguanylate cyclase (GGDEF)-like protein
VLVLRENSRLLTRLDHSASHDALTGLPNRALFGQRLERALAAGDDRPVAVALIDLDDFKQINDTLGHDVGDQLLVEFARRLTGCVRDGDTVARLGGDEFVAVLDGADPAEADRVAGRMVAALRPDAAVEGHELPLRASIGIAGGRAGDDAAVLRRRADMAMYLAKEVAGTSYLRYDENSASQDSAGQDSAGQDSAGQHAAGRPEIRMRPAAEFATAVEQDQRR